MMLQIFTSWCLVFLTCSTAITARSLHLPESTCRIQYATKVEQCVFTQKSVSTGYYPYIKQDFNATEGVWNGYISYTNVSISYPHGFHGTIHFINQHAFGVEHQIDLQSQYMSNSHFTLTLAYLPYTLSDLSVQREMAFGNAFLSEDPCQNSDAMKQCSSLLKSSKLTMKPKQNSIELRFGDQWMKGLKVELYGRSCNSGCDELYPSCTTNLTTLLWENPMTELVVNDLVSANYCARVFYNVRGNDCCNIYTKTIAVRYVQWIPHTPHNFHISTFFYYMFIVVLVVIVITILIHLRPRTGLVRSTSMKTIKMDSLDQTQQPLIRDLSPEILLLYPRKNIEFMDMMNAFRKLLSGFTTKVWDQFDNREIENVIANPARWMQQVLNDHPDIKIVLVETDNAIKWYSSDQRTLDIDDEDLYFPAISFIHNQPDLTFNYQRVLVVRFDKPRSDKNSLNIVPQKRFNMPHQLGLLIMDITNCKEYSLEPEPNHPTLETFYKTIEDYQNCSSMRQNSKGDS